eukprot:EG_transcript_283
MGLPTLAPRLPSLLPVFLFLLVSCLLHPAAGDGPGVNATHIVIGQTAPLTGGQAASGNQIAAGLQAAFAEANAAGGVQSRNITLLTLDDVYTSSKAATNFVTLQNKTLALAALFGTDITTTLMPLAVAANMPAVGPFSGAAATRVPFQEQILNVRASFTDEMVVQVILLVQQLRVHRIAVFYQNDSFGNTYLASVTTGLNYVGLGVAVSASYPVGSLAVESAYAAIAGYPGQVQAVVMASLQAQSIKFLTLFWQDNRTDPNCTFLFYSGGTTATFATSFDTKYWPNLYITQVVPPLDTPNLDIVTQFLNASSLYTPNVSPGIISFQAYIIGRLIVEVLGNIAGPITRAAFLNELYNTRLYAFGGLFVGMYSRNFTNCDRIVCASNIGLRSIFPAMPNPSDPTGTTHYVPSLGYYSYSVMKLGYPMDSVVRPLLFGQLLPLDDPVWRKVAEAIGQQLQDAFDTFNVAGGVNGRPVQLLQQYYSGDPAPQAAALANRYALLAFIGSVVNHSSSLQPYAAAQIGTYQTDRPAEYAAYNYTEVQVQASLPLEIMALAAFAYRLGQPVHFRAPNNPKGLAALEVMLESLNSFQAQPATSRTYTSGADALQGLSAGTVIAIGSDADVEGWFLTLAGLPDVRLLTTSPRAMHLLATLDVADYSQASRFHYPYMFNVSAAQVVSGVDVQDAALYGQLLGGVLQTVLKNANNWLLAYTTTDMVLTSWYGSQYQYNGVILGPYYSTTCTDGNSNCECNEGVRQVTVLTALRQEEPIAVTFSHSGCHVTYQDLIIPAKAGNWYIGLIVGVAVGVAFLALAGWWLSRRGRRDNATAPKNPHEPFCILFTDIQASTHLWATVPDIMAAALYVHHELIRRLLVKHKLYEVKTIGDSFMCATRHPAHGVRFALELQRELYHHDWGTDRIDTAYMLQVYGKKGKWDAGHHGWNGLRVRVGIHHGMGEIYLDPVSKGYDYYGTVVNTAARVEAVCHGGQVGITQAVFDALKGEFPGSALTDLGEQILRGLSEPLHLYQLVPTELSTRTFPPLRLEYSAAVEIEGRRPSEDGSKYSMSKSVMHSCSSPGSRAGAGTRRTGGASSAWTGANNWAETHAMVRSGQLTVQDLTVRYLTVLKALTTLLETQTQRVRETTVRAFCERLHVHNAGTEGRHLEETLNGIVQRVLPAALHVVGAANRRASADSSASSDLGKSLHPDHNGYLPDTIGTLGMCSVGSEVRSPYAPEDSIRMEEM